MNSFGILSNIKDVFPSFALSVANRGAKFQVSSENLISNFFIGRTSNISILLAISKKLPILLDGINSSEVNSMFSAFNNSSSIWVMSNSS